MFGMNWKFVDRTQKVLDAEEKGAFKTLGHAAASLRKDARSTITRAPKDKRVRASKAKGRRARHAPSKPGTPPHTQRGQLPNAITYSVEPRVAYIGPRRSRMAGAGRVHEFGGRYKGASYPARPYMAPALQRAVPRFAGRFTGSIGE